MALLFRNEDGTSHTLNLHLPEYSAVLVDCLEGVHYIGRGVVCCLKGRGEGCRGLQEVGKGSEVW